MNKPLNLLSNNSNSNEKLERKPTELLRKRAYVKPEWLLICSLYSGANGAIARLQPCAGLHDNMSSYRKSYKRICADKEAI